MSITLNQLNQASASEFIEILGSIFEHSPWVAEASYQYRPFNSLNALQQTMCDCVRNASEQKRLTLIRNHPQLAGKEADQGTLTTDSQREQSSAGLDQCSADELELLRGLNRDYLQKFDFPFVIAVSGLNKHQVIDAMQTRLGNSHADEFVTSIKQICKIAEIRLRAIIEA